MNVTEYYQQKRKQDYEGKYSDLEIQTAIQVGKAHSAQAMLAYNEAIDRRWAQFDGPPHVYDYTIIRLKARRNETHHSSRR